MAGNLQANCDSECNAVLVSSDEDAVQEQPRRTKRRRLRARLRVSSDEDDEERSESRTSAASQDLEDSTSQPWQSQSSESTLASSASGMKEDRQSDIFLVSRNTSQRS